MKIDKNTIRRRFSANLHSYDLLADTQREICRELWEMLAARIAEVPIARALEIGAGTGFLTRHLTKACPAAHWTLNDLVPQSLDYLDPMLAGISHDYLWGDAEALPFPLRQDLIASASTVQWMDDLSALLEKCASATRSGGFLAFSTFGGDNFREIRSLTGRGLEYPDMERLCEFARRAGYRVIDRRQYAVRLSFPSPEDVLRHIRATGVGISGGGVWTRGRLRDFSRGYAERFPHPDGGVSLTYHPVFMLCSRE